MVNQRAVRRSSCALNWSMKPESTAAANAVLNLIIPNGIWKTPKAKRVHATMFDMSYMLRNGEVGSEAVTANATLLREKRSMGDGKDCCRLMKLPICHQRVHRPLLANCCPS
ncbi:hypothetical protein EMIT0P294_10076 [Pseudomonas sp. IT-P294]